MDRELSGNIVDEPSGLSGNIEEQPSGMGGGFDGYLHIGIPGKSAYQYALEAGYTGTEQEFAEALARIDDTAIDEAAVLKIVEEYLTEHPAVTEETDPTVPDWAKKPNPPTYTAADVGALPDTYVPPDQTAEQVGADPAGTAAKAVSAHNTDTDAHGDLRLELQRVIDQLAAFFDTDDATLDQLSEILTVIKGNQSLIEAVTTSKVNVSDIIDNLTTNVANKPLSGAQGVVLKGLIDDLTTELGKYALKSAIPTKVSQLTNDSGYLTEVPVKSVNGKTGEVNLSAADVGARPNSWTPTASEVGARPDTWMPTAAQVGARPNSWTPTASEVGADPSGAASGAVNAHNSDTSAHPDIRKQFTDQGLAVSVKALGAKGDNSTNDTAVFQSSLAADRRVFVPGGTYKLSGELVIRDNCQLELAQDAVLNFTQTSGNCITVNRSSWLKGNHATIFVPYGFTGNVIFADTTVHTNAKNVPPWSHWDPQWKTARYITDINICKCNSNGLHYSNSGDTKGTALYMSATGGGVSTFMWGTIISGLRIAGAFDYGIRAVNFSEGWQHEMRIESVIDGCRIGCSLEDCNNVYSSVVFQPRAAADDTAYCEHGIQLIRCENTDLTGSRVWDWGPKNAKWQSGGQYQHIALYGLCRATILNDYNYYHLPTGTKDIRELIYTDTPANFDSLIIVQEPFTRWFKPVDGVPYFYNGETEQRLLLKSDQDALFHDAMVPLFTNQLPKATDARGAVFYEKGYTSTKKWNTSGTLSDEVWGAVVATGFIKAKNKSVVRVRGVKMLTGNEDRVILFDANKTKLIHINAALMIDQSTSNVQYTEVDDGFDMEITYSNAVEYFVFNFHTSAFSSNTIITVDEEIVYKQEGFLADGIYVNGEYVTGLDEIYVRQNQSVQAISEDSTHGQIPTAKAVYDMVSGVMGSYVDTVDALIGGGG